MKKSSKSNKPSKIIIEDDFDNDDDSINNNEINENTDNNYDLSSEINVQLSGYKFIDLFCGIGGFHQALNAMGAECVLACDIDKDCREVYKENYGIEPVPDVTKIDEHLMPDFDILCGGFPCQAFSNGGKKKCFDDERGLLFDHIIRIAEKKKPKFMFLENVKHILKVSNGEVIKYIKQKLDKIGYHLQDLAKFQISPHNYGIPQQRERVYFVCIRKDIYETHYISNEIMLPPPIPKEKIQFEKFLDEKENIDLRYLIKNNKDILQALEVWDEMIKKFDVGEKISPTIMINDYYKMKDGTYTQEDIMNFASWRTDYTNKNKPLIEKYESDFNEWYPKYSDILQKREIYGKLEWQTGHIKENDSIFNHFIQIRQSGIRVKKGNYFPTLVAISQIPIYGKEKRYITPRECARLQSFPESFKLTDNTVKGDKKYYKQFGNSVNVDIVSMVIRSTMKLYINNA